MYKYYAYLSYGLSDSFLLFIDGVLKSPGIDYIVEREQGQPGNCGGIFIIFKDKLKTACNICIVLNGDDFWYKVSSKEKTFVDQSKDVPRYSERMSKWL